MLNTTRNDTNQSTNCSLQPIDKEHACMLIERETLILPYQNLGWMS